jgi:hypothetical protein
MRVKLICLVSVCGATFLAAFCLAAPLPTLGPVDIQGTVVEATWSPKITHKGLPGMSGPAGQDRTVPARYRIRLKDYAGLDAKLAWEMNTYLDQAETKSADKKSKPPVLLLQIDSEDKDLLRRGMKIRITGYSLMGDEAGNYSKYEKLKVVDRPAKAGEGESPDRGKSIPSSEPNK